MRIERLHNIFDYVSKNEYVSYNDLTSEFGLSNSTIRRDITQLVEEGKLIKVYGGVAVTSLLISQSQRNNINTQDKKIIAKIASNFVSMNDFIYIDSGTTTKHILNYLPKKINISVSSHSLPIIVSASIFPNITIITFGGEYIRRTETFLWHPAINSISCINFNKAFISTSGIDLNYGLANNSFLECEIKKAIVKNSKEVILLADHTKFDKFASHCFCSITDVKRIITSKPPPKKYLDYCQQNDVELIFPS